MKVLDFDSFRRFIAEVSLSNASTVPPDARMCDLGIDSLAMLELASELQLPDSLVLGEAGVLNSSVRELYEGYVVGAIRTEMQ